MEQMSVNNRSPSRIPRMNCQCGHHRVTIPCPATADPKLKPKCCYCKKNRPDRAKSSEKYFAAHDESTAEEPHASNPGIAENAASSGKVTFGQPRKEIFGENHNQDDLEKNFNILRSEKETLETSRADLLGQVSSLQEQLSMLTTEHKSTERECKDLKEQISKLTAENKSMKRECEELKEKISQLAIEKKSLRRESEGLTDKLKSVEEREERKSSEIANEVQKWRSMIKETESSLTNEKNELNTRIVELTNTVKEQKNKITELTSICAKQKSKIEETEKKFSSKSTELCDVDKRLKSKCCECKDLQEEIENLKRCLNEESKAADSFKKETDHCKEDCRCELLTKEKIIENLREKIKKIKTMINDHEKKSQQAAREYESLSDELYSIKKENNELKMIVEGTVQDSDSKECHQCRILREQVKCLAERKQQALIAARYTAKKLCETTDEFESQLSSEIQQHEFLMSILKQKDQEIECLKKEIRYLRLCK
ncbi:myosin heavy chain, skeletal muscle-like [Diachasmimorpha longicaudata]|uniref:myosin heavy chain, skeletal muscle-like n=1 Tax=Diachasmimorpha longicaudata TaxID=58733 RepID=UPI0030B88922